MIVFKTFLETVLNASQTGHELTPPSKSQTSATLPGLRSTAYQAHGSMLAGWALYAQPAGSAFKPEADTAVLLIIFNYFLHVSDSHPRQADRACMVWWWLFFDFLSHNTTAGITNSILIPPSLTPSKCHEVLQVCASLPWLHQPALPQALSLLRNLW